MATRKEHDFIGEMEIDDSVYYGIQTMRAVENFNITHDRLLNYPIFIRSFAQVKKAAALANAELGLIEIKIKDAICHACDKIIDGEYQDQFVVDMIQGGAGTSTNMNMNEVIANVALEYLGHKKGEYQYCHPNDHVNRSQSTNDAYPSALKIAIYERLDHMTQVLKVLKDAFARKAKEFAHVLKMGRTQLQDAVPMTLGQEFETFVSMVEKDIQHILDARNWTRVINLGGTAIGTGINSHPDYKRIVEKKIQEVTGRPFTIAHDLIEASQSTGSYVQVSGALKRVAIKLSKICNDLRLLSSGPRAGLNEINLPKMQPGSSIMPGKVNPVIPEVVNQVCFSVIGNDLAVAMAAEGGQLQLNVFEPVIAYKLFHSFVMLNRAIRTLVEKCINGITANEKICHDYVFNSIGIVTALNPHIGYEKSASIAKEALDTGKSVHDIVLERKLLTKEQLAEIFQPENMLSPHAFKKHKD
ncbi:aspartate ammonia-lyase [Helicobacter salomonis]|uniref:aspartate ammonia-lyase n=1 Tax=Helicobacter salomonis TaxID=56878 RepID=UPI000CF114E2|nr:aspartate ammonia-lyase [Helicobacter salomonis]